MTDIPPKRIRKAKVPYTPTRPNIQVAKPDANHRNRLFQLNQVFLIGASGKYFNQMLQVN